MAWSEPEKKSRDKLTEISIEMEFYLKKKITIKRVTHECTVCFSFSVSAFVEQPLPSQAFWSLQRIEKSICWKYLVQNKTGLF